MVQRGMAFVSEVKKGIVRSPFGYLLEETQPLNFTPIFRHFSPLISADLVYGYFWVAKGISLVA